MNDTDTNKGVDVEIDTQEKSILQVSQLNQFYGQSHTLWDLDLKKCLRSISTVNT